MRLIAIRHGQTVWNAEGRRTGHADSELTAAGIQQMEKLARRLKSSSIDALYSSDLGRALKSAEIVSSAVGLKVEADPRLREQHQGIFTGLTHAEVIDRYPEEIARSRLKRAAYRIPGGESRAERWELSIACLNEIAERHSDGTAVAVTHLSVIFGILSLALRLPGVASRHCFQPNAAWNCFRRVGGRWILETWGDVAHLADGD